MLIRMKVQTDKYCTLRVTCHVAGIMSPKFQLFCSETDRIKSIYMLMSGRDSIIAGLPSKHAFIVDSSSYCRVYHK